MPNFETLNTCDSDVLNVGRDLLSARDITYNVYHIYHLAVVQPSGRLIDESSRGETGGLGWGEAEEGRGAWQEAADGTVHSLLRRLLRAFGFPL
ncbi:hypothetical protein FIBSPDRAFT_1049324 [Athelia psychrophila]|uniref:Uncharacterized protein n=1 Tax=Athelia psychrophila TaxID=1759441 RepID=A0A166CGQ7_9AGAM|nr:hypothetical protein FIBSPDRAFT_1049324 [Fibularhizoctonia sp. CBS 109695]